MTTCLPRNPEERLPTALIEWVKRRELERIQRSGHFEAEARGAVELLYTSPPFLAQELQKHNKPRRLE